jgi:indole-3-glycerol phosphate synthase
VTTLDEIVAHTRGRVDECKRTSDIARLVEETAGRPEPLSLSGALEGTGTAIIAEVKKASPSRGLIRMDFDPVAIAETYVSAGASAISVLTEPHFFLGSTAYLADIGASAVAHRVPLLRKDFIIDPYQVYEARANGADALLLIAAILSATRLKELLELSHELGMECLVEAHDENEVDIALASGARVIGINNRDLHTFSVDLATFERLRPMVPDDRLVVAESGIHTPADIARLAHAGADAVLVGETLMASDDVGARLRELLCAT